MRATGSSKATGNVRLGAWVAGRGEEMRRGAELDELADKQEGGEIADACGLLHVVGDGDDGAEIFQLNEELFDFRGADGIESGARLVEEKNFGLDGQGAGDAEALLLAAGKIVGGLVELVFHFVPEGGMAEAFLDGVRHRKLRAIDAETISHVFEDGFGERIGALEDHADAAAELSNVLGEDVLAVEQDFALEAGIADGFVHAVERAQESGFAAAGRADERGDFVCGDAQVDIEEGLLAAVPEIDLGDGHSHIRRGRSFAACAGGYGWSYVHRHCLPHRSVHGLRPRNRYATGQNRPSNNVNNENQSEQHESPGPSLAMPVIVRRDGVVVNRDRE